MLVSKNEVLHSSSLTHTGAGSTIEDNGILSEREGTSRLLCTKELLSPFNFVLSVVRKKSNKKKSEEKKKKERNIVNVPRDSLGASVCRTSGRALVSASHRSWW